MLSGTLVLVWGMEPVCPLEESKGCVFGGGGVCGNVRGEILGFGWKGTQVHDWGGLQSA